jgi:glycosyl transferase family 25
MKAYVINLARAPERRAHMQAELARAGIDFEFVGAVDGLSIDVADHDIVAPKWLGRSPFWPTVAGCALSHLAVYRRALEEGASAVMVLEDDVKLAEDTRAVAEEIGATLQGSEVALLHFHSREPCRLARRGAAPLPGGRWLMTPLDISQLGSAGAYVITAEACARMARAVLPVRVPADDWAYFVSESALDRIFCVNPVVVTKAADFRSTIGYYDRGGWGAWASELSERLPVPGLQEALRRRRQRIHDQWSRVVVVDDLAQGPPAPPT